MGLLEQYLYKNCVKKGLYSEINMEGAAHDVFLEVAQEEQGPCRLPQRFVQLTI